MAESVPTHPTALGPTSPSLPCQMTKAARAARTVLRASVDHPAGAECSCPKQRHSGLRPRARLAPIAAAKSDSNASAPTAPHRAVVVGTSAAATASSASGRKTPSGPTRAAGTPKSTIACREPSRSASFATPAAAKTMASNSLAHRRVASIAASSFRRSTRSSPAKPVCSDYSTKPPTQPGPLGPSGGEPSATSCASSISVMACGLRLPPIGAGDKAERSCRSSPGGHCGCRAR